MHLMYLHWLRNTLMSDSFKINTKSSLTNICDSYSCLKILSWDRIWTSKKSHTSDLISFINSIRFLCVIIGVHVLAQARELQRTWKLFMKNFCTSKLWPTCLHLWVNKSLTAVMFVCATNLHSSLISFILSRRFGRSWQQCWFLKAMPRREQSVSVKAMMAFH